MFALGDGGIAELVLQVVQLRASGRAVRERGPRLVAQGAARVHEAVLRQVADRQALRLDDPARVGLVEPGQHAQQRGLAGAVRTAQPDPVAQARAARSPR